MPWFKHACHDTLSFDATRFHVDRKGLGLESITTFTLGTKVMLAQLPCDGGMALPILSALIFPAYRVQVLVGAIGSGGQDGDVQLVDACEPLACHGNVGSGARGAFLRSQSDFGPEAEAVVYVRGGSLCDHENGERIGERGYVDSLRRMHQMTIQDAWAACAAGGIRAYRAMTAAARQALHAQFAGVPAMSHAANQQRAQQLNPRLP